jgi:hypothetical protein
MYGILGESFTVFLGLNVLLFGLAAFLTGQAQANAWRPVRNAIVYSLLLGLGERFLAWSLFGGPLLSLPAYLINTAVLMAIAVASWRMTTARKMVCQYPWLYERSGPFAWRERKIA